ncbi:hypothetical protein [Oenococcus oeni]|uniref:Uncharacterized protein n=11 Tax=Oenococcus oeni TaxID=1247 RepID=Q04HF1_OENOB|nr:hypothetical protein [Oenococcus oeni]EAV39782.1 hypothetical protein OENOO_46015 [Oenococcus oeni ATCC BAA-1163]KGO17118.1 hypothetical protein OA32_00860 [Oenococcus oeni X2L]MDN6968764.1 hypothetical protein [Oenococcus sp. UCMA 17063]ABJ56121.1 hypothetical protein OEOE_0127 [Oenococcus oeni PSU-1]AVI93443.1 hypothetical protein AX764_00555 [Oenococcus oeni]
MTERTFIDPEKFALSFSKTVAEGNVPVSEYVDKAKEQMLAYLTAYYLVQDFDKNESKNFGSREDKKFSDLSFNELLTRIAQLNKY